MEIRNFENIGTEFGNHTPWELPLLEPNLLEGSSHAHALSLRTSHLSFPFCSTKLLRLSSNLKHNLPWIKFLEHTPNFRITYLHWIIIIHTDLWGNLFWKQTPRHRGSWGSRRSPSNFRIRNVPYFESTKNVMSLVIQFQSFYNNKDMTDWPNEKPVCVASIGLFVLYRLLISCQHQVSLVD